MTPEEFTMLTKMLTVFDGKINALRRDVEKAFKSAGLPFAEASSRVAPEDRLGPTPGAPRQADLDDATLVALHESGELKDLK